MKRNRLALFAFAAAGILAGCELIVDFDRTKIDGGVVEGGTNDVVSQPDTSMADSSTMDVVDSSTMDTSKMDSTMETSTMDANDAAVDVAPDVALDAPDAD